MDCYKLVQQTLTVMSSVLIHFQEVVNGSA
jgi:hypothetical protein